MTTNGSRKARGGSKTLSSRTRVGGSAFTALSLLLLLVGCGDEATKALNDPSAPAGTGPVDASAPAPAPPAVGGESTEGVYVSATKGTDGTDGAKLRPLKTIAEGQTMAASKHLPLIVCAERYDETITLIDGVTIYGYFDCSNLEKWQRVASRASLVAPTSPAVTAKDLTLAARFEGFDIQSADQSGSALEGNQPAASSYGMTIFGSKNLALAEVSIRAGGGQDGRDGLEPAHGPVEMFVNEGTASSSQHPCDNDLDGLFTCLTAKIAAGPAGGTSSCGGGPGGAGGSAPISHQGKYELTDLADAHGKPSMLNPVTASGGFVTTPGLGGWGSNGLNGANGTTGANGQWSLDVAGFVPGNGVAGAAGSPGQGGGGGAGAQFLWNVILAKPYPVNQAPENTVGGVGASGGAGGCAGVAGTAGTGGGASIGLLVVDSEITLAGVQLEAQKGGRGGKGTLGTLGTPGGAGGVGAPTVTKWRGAAAGKGGDGGAAGLSGHGAPGPSIALAFKGARPNMSDVMLVTAVAAEGGAALSQAGQTLPAIAGVSKGEHQF